MSINFVPRARAQIAPVGEMYALGIESVQHLVVDTVRGRFPFSEFVSRCYFLANATTLPAMLVSIPLGMAIVLQVGGIASQIGASSFVGAAGALGILRQASPIVTALLLAGVGGSAVCAELGARTMREEIDAMKVMGINPAQRLISPLLLAGVVMGMTLNLVVIFVCVLSGYYFDLLVLGGSPGSFADSFSQFAGITDLIASEIKAGVFGGTAALIAAFIGLNARSGPAAVGEAVNKSVVMTGVLLFAQNLILTQLFFSLFPQRTF